MFWNLTKQFFFFSNSADLYKTTDYKLQNHVLKKMKTSNELTACSIGGNLKRKDWILRVSTISTGIVMTRHLKGNICTDKSWTMFSSILKLPSIYFYWLSILVIISVSFCTTIKYFNLNVFLLMNWSLN